MVRERFFSTSIRIDCRLRRSLAFASRNFHSGAVCGRAFQPESDSYGFRVLRLSPGTGCG